ncbi:MAG: hypothetical protein U0528_00220 [Anaerolineae bacterium]
MPASAGALSNTSLLINRVSTNLLILIQAEYVYLTPLLPILLLVGTLLLIRHNASLTLLLMSLISVTFLSVAVLAGKLWLRYIAIAAPYLLLLARAGSH